MMAFETNSKRSSQDTINSVDSKKRKVEFAKDVTTLHPVEHSEVKSTEEVNGFSSAIYARFVKSALDDLERVCLRFF